MKITSIFVAAIAAVTSTSNAVQVQDGLNELRDWNEETDILRLNVRRNAIDLSTEVI